MNAAGLIDKSIKLISDYERAVLNISSFQIKFEDDSIG